jgi:hypothetical protein
MLTLLNRIFGLLLLFYMLIYKVIEDCCAVSRKIIAKIGKYLT